MNSLTGFIKNELLCHGADIVGFGDLSELPSEVRADMPNAAVIAVYVRRPVRQTRYRGNCGMSECIATSFLTR